MACTRRIAVSGRVLQRGVVCALLAALAVLAIGCSRGPEHLVIDLTDEDLRGEPDARTRTEILEGGLMVDYHLEVADRIRVDFFYNPDLGTDLMVRPDGRITLPGIGEVMAAGRTPREVSDEIETRYSDILLQPTVTLTVKEVDEPGVYVIGLVKHPGPVVYDRNMTAASAVAAAGGPDAGAKLGSVIVIRRLPGSRLAAARLNLNRVFKGEDALSDMYLEPYDIVFVPKRFVSHLKDFSLDVVRTVVPAMNLYLRGWE